LPGDVAGEERCRGKKEVLSEAGKSAADDPEKDAGLILWGKNNRLKRVPSRKLSLHKLGNGGGGGGAMLFQTQEENLDVETPQTSLSETSGGVWGRSKCYVMGN